MDLHPALRGAAWANRLPTGATQLDADELAAIVGALASRPDLWQALVRHDPRARWYRRVALTEALDVWLIGWWPGQHTGLHDHGGASGALAVVGGVLQETLLEPGQLRRLRVHHRGALVPVRPEVIHRVGNVHRFPATTIHAYSPPGLDLNEHDPAAAARPLPAAPDLRVLAGAA